MNPWMTEQDEAALAQFEAIALSQKPAEQPWRPITDYGFEARRKIEGDHPQLIRDVFRPDRVIDAGCGPDAVLVRLLRELDVDARGFDVQIAGSKRHGIPSHLCVADLAMPPAAFPIKAIGRADVVICREVLEHLTLIEIARAVRNLCRLSTQFVYCTTRHTQNPTSFLAVAQSDDLDPTHISLGNQAWLRHLFVLEGFRRREDLEEMLDHRKLGRCLVYERA